jgi:hypothetical protein
VLSFVSLRKKHDPEPHPTQQTKAGRTFESLASNNLENLLQDGLVTASRVITDPRLQNQSKEILQQQEENSDISHRAFELELPLVVIALYPRSATSDSFMETKRRSVGWQVVGRSMYHAFIKLPVCGSNSRVWRDKVKKSPSLRTRQE